MLTVQTDFVRKIWDRVRTGPAGGLPPERAFLFFRLVLIAASSVLDHFDAQRGPLKPRFDSDRQIDLMWDRVLAPMEEAGPLPDNLPQMRAGFFLAANLVWDVTCALKGRSDADDAYARAQAQAIRAELERDRGLTWQTEILRRAKPKGSA